MKKSLAKLFVLSLAATALSGCDFSDIINPSDELSNKVVDHLDLRNYKTATLLNSNYEFEGQVFAICDDNTEVDVTSRASFTTLDTSKLGESPYKVTVETSKDIYSLTLKIKNVEYIDVSKIEIVDYSETAEVGVDYVFDGKVIATYIDSTTKDVTNEAVISPLDVSKKETSELVVSYTEHGLTKNVVKPIEVLSLLKSIKVSRQTNVFIVNDEFVFDGVVKATYSDGSVIDVTDSITIDSNSINTKQVGNYSLKVSYKEKDIILEEELPIAVLSKAPNLISIEAIEYSITAIKTKEYSFDGTIIATFDEGPKMDVTNCVSFSSISTDTIGNKDLTISFVDPRTNIKRTTIVSIEVISHISEIKVPKTLKVKTGGTSQLTPIVLPDDAKNKDFTFISSDPTIAQIDKNGQVSGLQAGTSIITVISNENPEISAQTTINVCDSGIAEWSIFLYVCGSDLETYSAEATYDLEEIDSVANKPNDVNIVVEAGGANRWHSYSSVINSSKLNRFHLTSGSYVKDEQIDSASMGDPNTLESFLEWGIKKYPAEKSALILWNHGGGLSGCCIDEIYGDCLMDDEVVSAVNQAFWETGLTEFEWIGYDCCLMQSMEIAEFNSKYFKYQVASQEAESGYGWDYDSWIGDVYDKKSSETILTSVVDSFINQFPGGEDSTSSGSNQTLSYLDLSKMAEFKDAWEALANKTNKLVTSSNKNDFWNNVVKKSHYFGGYVSYGEFDCYHYLENLKANSTYNPGDELVDETMNALTALIKHNKAQKGGSADAHGLSCYFYSSYNDLRYSHFNEWVSLVDKVL